MALPRKLKNMNIFNEGASYLGEAASITLPKLTRKLEDWRGGGMDGTVKLDMGADAMEAEWSTGGPMRDVLRQFGTTINGAFLRFAGVFQNDGTGEVDQVEVTVRGRHEEIDMGEWKPGEGGEFKVKSALVYYRLDWNGATEIEIDVLNMVFNVGGVDRLAELRDAIL
jgi:hypothetical protein